MIRLNIWASYFGGWDRESKTFPWIDRKGKEFADRDELLTDLGSKYGEDSSQGLYYSSLMDAPLSLLWDDEIQGWISKYLFCERFAIRPFLAECYEDQPAFWIDFCLIMAQEMAACQKEQLRADGAKRH